MFKPEFQRSDLKKNFLRQVIFRIDYQGIVSVEKLIESFNQEFANDFEGYNEIFQNEFSAQITNFDDISKTLSIPIGEIKKQAIHRYTKPKNFSNILTLDISKYFTALTIDCKEYSSFDNYTTFIKRIYHFLEKSSNFFTPKRIGLRKISNEMFENLQTGFESFEKDVFYSNFYNSDIGNMALSQKFDVIKCSNGGMINFGRKIETGRTEKIEIVNLFSIDIDGYYLEDAIKHIRDGSPSDTVIDNIIAMNNGPLFDLFKYCVTRNFLQGCKGAKTK